MRSAYVGIQSKSSIVKAEGWELERRLRADGRTTAFTKNPTEHGAACKGYHRAAVKVVADDALGEEARGESGLRGGPYGRIGQVLCILSECSCFNESGPSRWLSPTKATVGLLENSLVCDSNPYFM